MAFSSFSWLNNINCVYTCHVFFIHSCINGHILLLWIILKWTWWFRYLFEMVILFLCLTPWSGIARLYSIFFLVFWEVSTLFSILAIPMCLSINSVPGFLFLYIFTNTYYLLSSDTSHSNRCEVISHCGFDLHFSGGLNKARGKKKAIYYCELFCQTNSCGKCKQNWCCICS